MLFLKSLNLRDRMLKLFFAKLKHTHARPVTIFSPEPVRFFFPATFKQIKLPKLEKLPRNLINFSKKKKTTPGQLG